MMKNQGIKFDISEHKSIKIISGDVIRITNIENFIEDIESYNIIVYKSLLENVNEPQPYLKILSIISKELDKINFSPFKKKLNKIKYFITSVITFFIIISIIINNSDKFIRTFLENINIETETIYIQIFLSFIFVLVLVALLFTDIIETFPIFKTLVSLEKEPNFYFKKFQRFKKKENESIESFLKYSEKWFKKDKKYLLIIYYLNYETISDKNNNIYRLLTKLLMKHNNLKL